MQRTRPVEVAEDYLQFISLRCSLGFVLTAVSPEGICAILLDDTRESLEQSLRSEFPTRHPAPSFYDLEGIGAQTVNVIETPALRVSLPLHLEGPSSNVLVWRALQIIPAGETATYEQLANRLGPSHTADSVMRACLANRIAVAVPCHRAVAGGGGVGPYRWGPERKRALLDREGCR